MGHRLQVINVGDSRAVAARDGTAEALSHDHKPERADEQARVEKSGGLVKNFGGTWRVTTPEALAWGQLKIKKGPNPIQLAVARSFGDITLKAPRPLLLSVPEVTIVDLGKSDNLVLLGCDGIWDVLSNATAVWLGLGLVFLLLFGMSLYHALKSCSYGSRGPNDGHIITGRVPPPARADCFLISIIIIIASFTIGRVPNACQIPP